MRQRALLSGSHGLVGAALAGHLRSAGWEVVPLERRSGARGGGAGASGGPWWDIQGGQIELAPAGPIDAVINLAGEPIVGLWTKRRRRAIHDSRSAGTALLASAVASMNPRPSVFLNASAIGYYGLNRDDWVDESTGSGEGFLAEVCRDWERSARPAEQAGVRVVFARLGMVLSAGGGALPRMARPFAWHLGSVLGGSQYWSWIAMDDLLEALSLLLGRGQAAGPVNLVSPEPATSAEFSACIARLTGRRAWLRMPAGLGRVLMGRMGREVLFSSLRVRPAALERLGFVFRQGRLEDALACEMGKMGMVPPA